MMGFLPRTPNDQKCARPGCHHPFIAHEIEEHCGCQLKCLACGCSDFAYEEDFPSTPQGINSAWKKIEHDESETPKAQTKATKAL